MAKCEEHVIILLKRFNYGLFEQFHIPQYYIACDCIGHIFSDSIQFNSIHFNSIEWILIISLLSVVADWGHWWLSFLHIWIRGSMAHWWNNFKLGFYVMPICSFVHPFVRSHSISMWALDSTSKSTNATSLWQQHTSKTKNRSFSFE